MLTPLFFYDSLTRFRPKKLLLLIMFTFAPKNRSDSICIRCRWGFPRVSTMAKSPTGSPVCAPCSLDLSSSRRRSRGSNCRIAIRPNGETIARVQTPLRSWCIFKFQPKKKRLTSFDSHWTVARIIRNITIISLRRNLISNRLASNYNRWDIHDLDRSPCPSSLWSFRYDRCNNRPCPCYFASRNDTTAVTWTIYWNLNLESGRTTRFHVHVYREKETRRKVYPSISIVTGSQ